MGWKDDQETLPQVTATLGLLREGGLELENLVAMKDDAVLVKRIAELDVSLLRSIVFERVIAARYQPRPA